MPAPSAIDTEFALLHGLSPETVSILVDLAPHLSTRSDAPLLLSAHPASAPLYQDVVQDCFRLRYEAAERRYARMKGLVHASLEAQQRVEREVRGLRVADRIVRMGLEKECAATLAVMLQGGGSSESAASLVVSSALRDEIDGLTSRLASAVELNEKLMSMNRELRGLQRLEPAAAMAVEEQTSSNAGDAAANPSVESLTAEVATLRRQIILLELECTRLQSSSERFEADERLRECEDVFDQLLGCERSDFNEAEQGAAAPALGAVLRRFHPMSTCPHSACVAYARRLRGGFRIAVTDAYVRERINRVNGLVRQVIEPAETLRVQKDAEIRALRERVLRFEQSMRLTSEEADRAVLRETSLAILAKAAELDALKLECAAAEREFTTRRRVLSNLVAEERALQEDVLDARREIQGLAEERQLTAKVMGEFRDEQAALKKLREEINRFQTGQSGALFRRQQREAAVLAIEVDNLRIEREAAVVVDGGGDEGVGSSSAPQSSYAAVVGGAPADAAVSAAAATFAAAVSGGKRARGGTRRASGPVVIPAPDGSPLVMCKCGSYVPHATIDDHIQRVHGARLGPNRCLSVCVAGCGFFAIGAPSENPIQRHATSGECAARLESIARLLASGRSGAV